SRAHGVTFTRDPGFFCNVPEPHISFVVIKAIPILRSGLSERWNVGSICEENIWTTVAVIIEYGQASSHRLDHALSRSRAVVQNEVKAAFARHVSETNARDIGLRTGGIIRPNRSEHDERRYHQGSVHCSGQL